MESAAQKTLLIRADAGPGIGAGHVLRCLALAQGWIARGGKAVLLTSPQVGPLANRWTLSEATVEFIHETPGSAKDAQATLEASRRYDAEHLVVDGYTFDSTYQAKLAQAAPHLLWIDDLAHAGPYTAPLILNQNLSAKKSLYGDASQLLLGPRYALLRQEFLNTPKSNPNHQQALRLLVTLGGSDPTGLAGSLLDLLEPRLTAGTLEAQLVVGGLDPRREALERRSKDLGPGFSLTVDVQNMAPLMGRADLALSASGSTVWELAHLGVPALLVVVADNQRPNAEALHQLGIAHHLGDAQDLDGEALKSALDALLNDPERRANMARLGQELVDGRGVERVVAALLGDGEPSHG